MNPPKQPEQQSPPAPWRKKLYEIIFEAETPLGKGFDELLMACILLSVLAVMLESVSSLRNLYGIWFRYIEWFFTILFTLEYILRLISTPYPFRYAKSFFGCVDLLAIIPGYLSLLFVGTQSLIVIRALRLLRVFRVLKLGKYLGEAKTLKIALRASRRKVIVFLFTVLTVVIIVGTMMYLIEGDDHGFTSIPRSIYWAIVTMTTVGYGDIYPQTDLGRLLASFLMISGYGIIAVPTGIVTVEMANASRKSSTRVCPHCIREGHDPDARFCKFCGKSIQ